MCLSYYMVNTQDTIVVSTYANVLRFSRKTLHIEFLFVLTEYTLQRTNYERFSGYYSFSLSVFSSDVATSLVLRRSLYECVPDNNKTAIHSEEKLTTDSET